MIKIIGGIIINILYSTDCPKCKILKQKLDQKQIEYKECNDVEKMMELGFLSVPMLQVNKEVMDFNKAVKWVLNE